MVQLTRRAFAGSTLALALVGLARPAASAHPPLARVICDNDWAGDPDGLFQLAQHLLSPSIDIPLIVGSHLPPGWPTSAGSAATGADTVRELLALLDLNGRYKVLGGAEASIAARAAWQPGPATSAIVAEAMRDDGAGPLVYCAGAGLTEPALAWLAQPRIGRRMRLIWIGGNEHAGLALPPPGPPQAEFNFSIDPVAAQVIFNESDIEIWQVPRDVYRQMLVSTAELAELAETGSLGRYLTGQIERIEAEVAAIPAFASKPRSETYVLGDSPLVTLTALQSFFEPDPSSSTYDLRPTPTVDTQGTYTANPGGRPMRVYTRIDTRLTFADMVAKIRAADRRLAGKR